MLTAEEKAFKLYLDEFESMAEYRRLRDAYLENEDEDSLNLWVIFIAFAIASRASAVVALPNFKLADRKEQGRIVRSVLAPAVEKGHNLTKAATAQYLTSKFMKQGKAYIVPSTSVDKERLEGAIGGTMRAASQAPDKLESIVKQTFEQIIRTGQKDTVQAMARELKQREPDKQLMAKRVTSSSNPCKYCVRASTNWFYAGADSLVLYRMHDNCSCYLITRYV